MADITDRHQPPYAASKEKSGGSWLYLLTLLAALGMSAYSFKYVWSKRDSVDVPKVAVADVDLIDASFAVEVLSEQDDPEKQAQLLETKRRKVMEIIKSMEDEEVIVLDKSKLLAYPKANDITADIAAKAGIRLVDDARFKKTAPLENLGRSAEKAPLPDNSGGADLD